MASVSKDIVVDSVRGMETPGRTTHLIVITLGIDEVIDITSVITLCVGGVMTGEGLEDIEEDDVFDARYFMCRASFFLPVYLLLFDIHRLK